MLRRSLSPLILCLQAVVVPVWAAEEQLFLAAERGDSATVKNFLETYNVDPNVTNRFAWTPLHVASRHGFLDLVKLLVEQFDADLDAEDSEGDTPLYEAMMHGNVAVLSYLLEKGASLDWQNDRDEDLLDTAVKTENTQMVRAVVRRMEPDPEPRKRQALHLAVIQDALDMVEILLDAGVVHVDDRDASLRTPLHIAAGNGQYDFVYELILRGARVDVLDKSRKKPLAYAVREHRKADHISRRSFVRCIRLLVNARSMQTSLKRCAAQDCPCKQPVKKQRKR